jgi:IclR family acetate operon transcriptional repressor
MTMHTGRPVQAVVRSLRILEAVATADGAVSSGVGVIEVARLAGLSPGTTHRLLATLGAEGYVTQDETTSRYRLGPGLFALARAAESEITALRALVTPAMETLSRAFGETVNLAVLDRRHIIYVDQIESDRPIRAFNRTGNRVPAHASAAGKALLAFTPEGIVASLGTLPLESFTSRTITSTEELAEHLREVRRRGYALDLGEQDEEVICVASPVASPSQPPVAALSVSGPAQRMRSLNLDDVGAQLAAVASEILSRRA